MDPTTLRIKFSPLVKDIRKPSAICSLEIVPELSSIQNLDKIHWKESNDSIEYIVPINYKIIFRKLQQNLDELSINEKNKIKIYHSCVDLVSSSSIINTNLASGDVPKMISDTYILSNVLEKVLDNTILKNEISNSIIKEDTINKQTECGQDEPEIEHNNRNSLQSLKQASEAVDEKNEIIKDSPNINTPIDRSQSSDDDSLESIVKNDFITCNRALAQPLGKINKSTLVKHSAEDFIPRLNVAPICFVNTEEQTVAIANRKAISKSFSQDFCDIDNVFFPINSYAITKSLFMENYFRYRIFLEKFKYTSDCQNFLQIYDHDRALPEVRVTEFVKYMEREILPLKIMLQNIWHKCANLGITPIKQSQQSLTTKTYYDKSSKQVASRQKQEKSNRFVYTYVFDE